MNWRTALAEFSKVESYFVITQQTIYGIVEASRYHEASQPRPLIKRGLWVGGIRKERNELWRSYKRNYQEPPQEVPEVGEDKDHNYQLEEH
jgi:hypothetical protein